MAMLNNQRVVTKGSTMEKEPQTLFGSTLELLNHESYTSGPRGPPKKWLANRYPVKMMGYYGLM
jgi:hypothetical protein